MNMTKRGFIYRALLAAVGALACIPFGARRAMADCTKELWFTNTDILFRQGGGPWRSILHVPHSFRMLLQAGDVIRLRSYGNVTFSRVRITDVGVGPDGIEYFRSVEEYRYGRDQTPIHAGPTGHDGPGARSDSVARQTAT